MNHALDHCHTLGIMAASQCQRDETNPAFARGQDVSPYFKCEAPHQAFKAALVNKSQAVKRCRDAVNSAASQAIPVLPPKTSSGGSAPYRPGPPASLGTPSAPGRGAANGMPEDGAGVSGSGARLGMAPGGFRAPTFGAGATASRGRDAAGATNTDPVLVNQELVENARGLASTISGAPSSSSARAGTSSPAGNVLDTLLGPDPSRPGLSTINIQHSVRPFGQPTRCTCWSAATAMLLGRDAPVSPGGAKINKDLCLEGDFDNVQRFASAQNVRLYAPQSWTVEGLTQLLQRGPIAVGGYFPSGHMVVVGGISGDGSPAGTRLTIYDPWPVGSGQTYDTYILQP